MNNEEYEAAQKELADARKALRTTKEAAWDDPDTPVVPMMFEGEFGGFYWEDTPDVESVPAVQAARKRLKAAEDAEEALSHLRPTPEPKPNGDGSDWGGNDGSWGFGGGFGSHND